eukprot:g62783.t1
MPGKVVTLVGEICSLLAYTPIPSTNAQNNDDEDHTPLLVPTHENTNIPDSPTHDTEQPQHSESEHQDELSLEQSLQNDSYKQVSIGPTPNSDFTAPDADYTDPNQTGPGGASAFSQKAALPEIQNSDSELIPERRHQAQQNERQLRLMLRRLAEALDSLDPP